MNTPRPDWGFLLQRLCSQSQGISHALAVTADGLALAMSMEMPQEQADQLSATTSGLASLTRGAARLLNAGVVEQVVVDMAHGRLVIMAIGDGSTLTVLADKGSDLGQIAYDMAMLINSVGHALTPDPRRPQTV